MAKKKKSETIEDILDRMEQDIESIREKVEENMDENSDIDEEDEE